MQIIASILSLLAGSVLLVSKTVAGQTDNPAIVVVIDSSTHLDELCHTFFSLSRATGSPDAPIIAFKAITVTDADAIQLRSCTSRNVYFPDISGFYATLPTFPEGSNILEISGAKQIEFAQTQRFLTGYIWDQDILKPYDVLMRISDKTCLTFVSTELPGFPTSGTPLNYKSYGIPGELEITKYTVGLFPFTIEYISDNDVTPQNIDLWTKVVNSHTINNKLPKFSDDFEVVRKSFMQSNAVRNYHHKLTDSPQGALEFFKRCWPTSCVRHITVSLFADEDSTSIIHVPGIVEKNFWQGNFFENICRDQSLYPSQ